MTEIGSLKNACTLGGELREVKDTLGGWDPRAPHPTFPAQSRPVLL